MTDRERIDTVADVMRAYPDCQRAVAFFEHSPPQIPGFVREVFDQDGMDAAVDAYRTVMTDVAVPACDCAEDRATCLLAVAEVGHPSFRKYLAGKWGLI